MNIPNVLLRMNSVLATFRARLVDIEDATTDFPGLVALWDEFEVHTGLLDLSKTSADYYVVRFGRPIFPGRCERQLRLG
jgi:hypothetical protein